MLRTFFCAAILIGSAVPAVAQTDTASGSALVNRPTRPVDLAPQTYGPNQTQIVNERQIALGVPNTQRGRRAMRAAQLIDQGQCEAAVSLITRERDMRMLRRANEVCSNSVYKDGVMTYWNLQDIRWPS